VIELGEITEMILKGILCEECGGLVGDELEAVGYPRKCDSCISDSAYLASGEGQF
jgi:hypothetical protein